MRKVYTPPPFHSLSPLALFCALIISVLIFLVLPFTQMFSGVRKEITYLRQVQIALPPPPPPMKQPQVEEKREEVRPELKETLKPLTLSQLEVALNPGTGGATMDADFAFNFGTALGADGRPDVVEEMKIFQLAELDKEPQVIFQAEPLYPMRLLRDRIGGTVVIRFVVDEKGAVTQARVHQLSGYRELDQAALNAVLKYKFSPGIKDSKPVRAWFDVPITFKATR